MAEKNRRTEDERAELHHEHEEHESSAAMRIARLILGGVLFAAGILAEKAGAGNPLPLLLLLAAYLISGCGVLLRAGKNLLHGHIFDENFLMSVSTVGALAIGQTEEAAAVMLLYQLGEFLEDLAVDRARNSVTALLNLRPERAAVLRDGVAVVVDPEEVAVGETILIEPGERIPLDGTVFEGKSRVDTASVTGESVPRSVKPGSEVLAGCVNGEGLLTVKTTKPAGESAAAKILKLTEKAAERKAHAERFITKFARVYTPVVCAAALVIAVLPPLILGKGWKTWIARGLTALVISCPCALVISIPLTFFAGIGAASRAGVLLKGSSTLETLAKAERFVFDKTGTLTKGNFVLTKLLPADGFTPEELLELAARAEVHSSHPIAASIRQAYEERNNGNLPEPPESVKELPGLGVEASLEGHTVLAGRESWLRERGIDVQSCGEAGTAVYFSKDGRFAGVLVIADEIRPGSADGVAELHSRGISGIAMLTGDAIGTAEAVAREVGIDEVRAGLLPEGKAAELERMTADGKITVFVGDGVNDAPVLAAADVGVAIALSGLGSDAAVEAADAVLMTDELPALVRALDIARQTERIAGENIVFAVAVKVILMILGALGIVGMGAAVFGDVGVMLLAVANAMRKKA